MDSKKIPLIIGLSLPVFLVIALAAILYLPRFYVKPSYDFLYANGNYPSYYDANTSAQVAYTIADSRLTKQSLPLEPKEKPWVSNLNPPQFYRYSVLEERSVPLSSEEAMNLRLNINPESPDGFTLKRSGENLFEAIFAGGNYGQKSLSKGTVSFPVDLVENSTYGYDRQQFIGWVIP